MMRAAIYREFRAPLEVALLNDPEPSADGAVIEVAATGVCRSDWHGWMGHDPDIRLPHVPGHEISGTVAAVGPEVRHFVVGDRVTLPFVCGCGQCPQCATGNAQVCDRQTQPGFTHWGSYAERVAIHHADLNLVRLPDDIDHVTAASLGCRFATAYRAVVDQGGVMAGQWVAVHGCGGVGLSAVMIASSLGARVVAIDVCDDALALATAVGAEVRLRVDKATECVADVPAADPLAEQLRSITNGGAAVSIEAFGGRETCVRSIACLAKRGRHVQVGLMAGSERNPPLPMDLVIANELEIVGSHGMQATNYPAMLAKIAAGNLDPAALVRRTISLDEAAAELANVTLPSSPGMTVIDRFTAT